MIKMQSEKVKMVFLKDLSNEELRKCIQENEDIKSGVIDMMEFINENNELEEPYELDDESVENYFIEEVNYGAYHDSFLRVTE